MRYAIDLNARQSNRTLEQAIRRNAVILLGPRTWGSLENVRGYLVEGGSQTLTVCVDEQLQGNLESLVGVYCDAQFLLGEHRYLFSTNVIEMTGQPGDALLLVARPETIQVSQRRRYQRAQFAASAPVEIRWYHGQERVVLAELCNVGGDGLACRLDAELGESLLIGEVIQVRFELPGCERPFSFQAVICNKTPAGTPGKLILGTQFDLAPDDPESHAALAGAREYLATYLGQQAEGGKVK